MTIFLVTHNTLRSIRNDIGAYILNVSVGIFFEYQVEYDLLFNFYIAELQLDSLFFDILNRIILILAKVFKKLLYSVYLK